MTTTSYVDFTASARGIANRTNAAGTAVVDMSAEEDRLAQVFVTEGAVQADAFKVQATTGMVVTVGSGSAKADVYAIAGDVSGQGVYLARLDSAPVSVTVPAAEAAAVRTDEIYLIVADAAYDAGSVSLPRIGYRKGNPGGAAPGPDSTWRASALLASINVPAAATSITAGNVTDARSVSSSSLFPPGMVMPFGGGTAPGGWLLCDGSAVSRTTQARLFAVLGTTYGAGDGSTTFNLPDLRGRFPMGAGSHVLGSVGGAETHTMSLLEMPSHGHTLVGAAASSAGGHTHTVTYWNVYSDDTGTKECLGGPSGVARTFTSSNDGAHTHPLAGSTDSNGNGNAFSVLNPFLSLNFMIKV